MTLSDLGCRHCLQILCLPWRVDDLQAALKLNQLQLLRVSWLRRNGTHLQHDGICAIKMKNYSTKGNITAHLGLYALRRRSNAGAVLDAMFVR